MHGHDPSVSFPPQRSNQVFFHKVSFLLKTSNFHTMLMVSGGCGCEKGFWDGHPNQPSGCQWPSSPPNLLPQGDGKSLAGCQENKCTGGHRGGRGWCIATVAGKWAPTKVFLFKFLILKKSYKGSTSWESSCTWLRSTRQGAGVYILPKNLDFYTPLDEMR